MDATLTARVWELDIAGTADALAALLVGALLLLLIGREIASSLGARREHLNRNLTVAIAPLALVAGVVILDRLLALI